jgi:N-acetylglucosamine kinase-like BadF-type ATPase
VAYYLGIDGGGSKTTCAVGDEVSQLAIVAAGPSNITRVGEVRARESLHQAIRQACAAAGIAPRQVQRACIGVAGAGREQIASAVHRIVAEVIPGEIEVAGDMPIALEAAFGAGPGVIVIAGTGSIAYGRDEQGRTARAGGWGFVISDEGSAHWIGRAAVSGLLRAIDQELAQEKIDQGKDVRAAEDLLFFRKLKAIWNLHALDEFVRTANSTPDFAALFPAILAAADAGDALAHRVLAQAGVELAQLAGIVGRRLFAGGNASLSAVPVGMAGGVFRHSPRVREVFCNEVHKIDSRLAVNPQVVEPVAGALQMAREASPQTLPRRH